MYLIHVSTPLLVLRTNSHRRQGKTTHTSTSILKGFLCLPQWDNLADRKRPGINPISSSSSSVDLLDLLCTTTKSHSLILLPLHSVTHYWDADERKKDPLMLPHVHYSRPSRHHLSQHGCSIGQHDKRDTPNYRLPPNVWVLFLNQETREQRDMLQPPQGPFILLTAVGEDYVSKGCMCSQKLWR